MANTSAFLDLILPGFNEYRDSWWRPTNANFTTIDAWAEGIELEIVNARFQKSTLAEFLAVAHETTGTLIATAEVTAARNSAIYGYQTPEPANFDLGKRISQSDWEIFHAREAQADLRANHAIRSLIEQPTSSCVISGSKDANGYPTWMGTTGANVQIDGSVTAIMLSIDGRLARVRTLETLTLSGGDGIKYIYAEHLPDWDDGKIVVDGLAISPATPNGTTSLDLGNKPIYFNDLTQNFWPMKLDKTFLAGDLLRVIDSTEMGDYVVKEIIKSVTLGTSNQFSIIGLFPVGGVSSINYRVYDPLRCSLGFDTAETPAEGKVYIGEVYFSGGTIANFPGESIKFRPRHFKDTFVGEWIAVDISGTNGTPNLGTVVPGIFETKYAHNLGSDILDVIIQASVGNTGSDPVEQLTVGTLDASTLNVSITDAKTITKADTLVFTAPSHTADNFNPGTGDGTFVQGTFTPGSLAGTINYTLGGSITGSLTGSVYMERSVLVKWTKNYIWVKNAVLGKFFKDYSGTAKQTGYIRVVVRKRG